MIIYLYKKTHNKTGLQYLGKTTKDPYIYMGSGIDWKKHIKEYGCDVNTEILKECKDKKELSYWGRYYSNLWNIAASTDWANRIPETGGGDTPTETTKEKLRNSQIGRKKPPRTKEHIEKIACQLRGKSNYKNSIHRKGKPIPQHIRQKQTESLKEWYKSNSNLAKQKAEKAWKTRYERDLEKYKQIIYFFNLGYNNRSIQKHIKMDNEVMTSLRNKTHPIFLLFPELIQLMST
jgi:hypothetical protein